MEIIHKNIQFLRERRGWTQAELAERLGISKSMVGAYEEYRSVPRLSISMKMADVFAIDLDSFTRTDLSKIPAKPSVRHDDPYPHE